MIYTKDHRPAHAHVFNQGNEAIIEFEDGIVMRRNNVMNRSQLKRAMVLVKENRADLERIWREIYG